MESSDIPRPKKEYEGLSNKPDIIHGILEERGRSLTPREKVISNVRERTILTNFFADSEYSPDSRFGKFVRVLTAEQKVQTELERYARNFLSKPGEPSITVKETTKKIQNDLNTIRDVRKELGEEIFGTQSQEYTHRVSEWVKAGGVKQEVQRKEEKKQLLADVKTHFPLTSK